MRIAARLPVLWVICVALLWAWAVRRQDDELYPVRDDAYGAIHGVVFVATAPASLLAIMVASRIDGDFAAFTLAHVLWAVFAYLQWRLIVRVPAWLRERPLARGALWLVVIPMIVGGTLGILAGFDAATDSEHSLRWHTNKAVWITGFGVALGVLALLGRPGAAGDAADADRR